MEGVDRIYFAYPPQLDRLVEATANIAIAAKDAGVSSLVNMSQISVREGARSSLSHHHWLSEQVFDNADIGAIHIRPNYFAENLLLFNTATIVSEQKICLPYGERGHAPIAAFDIARVSVQLLLTSDSYVREKLILTGPERYTIKEIANIIGNEIGKPVEYVDLPKEQWLDILTHQVGFPEFLADHLYKVVQDHQDGIFDKKTDTVEQVT